MSNEIGRRLLMLFRRRQFDADLDEEMRLHRELREQEEIERGLSPKEARYAAQRRFGNDLVLREESRDMWGWNWLENSLHDVRYAWRTLVKNPGFAAIAVLTLGLGIGANTAIFTFVDASLLEPLPYPDAGKIVFIAERPPHRSDLVNVDPFNFLQWQARARSFDALALMQSIPANTMGPEGAEQLSGLWTTAGLFRVFGVSPALGRGFTEDETVAVGDPPTAVGHVAIISHALWQQRFASDPNIIGKRILLYGEANTVIGVMPAGFRAGVFNPDLYLPMPIDRQKPDSIGSHSFVCYGRLRAGVDLAAARAEMDVIAGRLGREYAMDQDWTAAVLSLRNHLTTDSRPVLLLLQGVVAFILLIVCSNVAGLLLTRSIGRRSELAVRLSLGAGRLRLIQLLGIESLVLSSAGGTAGLLLGSWASHLLYHMIQKAGSLGHLQEAHLDLRILAFTAGISLLTTLLCGLVPAWQVSRVDIQTTMRATSRGASESPVHRHLGGILAISQVALALVLLIGAGLLLRTFSHLLNVQLGFQPQRVLTMQMLILGDDSQRANKVEAILDRIRALPEVGAAGTIKFLPLGPTSGTGFYIAGEPEPAPAEKPVTEASLVSRGYFATMGIPVLEGRPFDERDRIGSPRVCLINRSFARRFFPGQDPIGRRLVVSWSSEAPTEIVGVVGDIRQNGPAQDPRPTVFLAQAQVPAYITHLVVRTSGDPKLLVNAIKHCVHEVDKGQSVAEVKTMDDYVSESLARPRVYSAMVTTFAILALALAAIGIYGVISYSVSKRAHEIGIRMALGARRGSVLGLVMKQGLRLALIGTALGLIGALVLTRFLSSFLYGVKPTDPLTFIAVSALLTAVALSATYLPARRATKVDPMVALRYE
ncbi:MAG TPA: ABC transporter permease [Terriglobia bacterium]|nr:ABC transporter permease [Terriglobia bacterium]